MQSLLDTLLEPITDPIIMMHPENTYHSLSDVINVILPTQDSIFPDQLQELYKIKQTYHANLKHQPELAPLHESELINALHDLQLKYQ